MSSDNLVILDDANWEKTVEKGDKPVAVMFSSPTCPFCQQMEPHFNEYAAEYKGKIVFAKVDIAESPTIASRYGVMGTPTFKFFCNGKPVYELTGAMYPSLLKKAVEESLEHGPSCEKSTTWIDPGIDGYA
jgi:thioredoxin-like negative regulator of GroEL